MSMSVFAAQQSFVEGFPNNFPLLVHLSITRIWSGKERRSCHIAGSRRSCFQFSVQFMHRRKGRAKKRVLCAVRSVSFACKNVIAGCRSCLRLFDCFLAATSLGIFKRPLLALLVRFYSVEYQTQNCGCLLLRFLNFSSSYMKTEDSGQGYGGLKLLECLWKRTLVAFPIFCEQPFPRNIVVCSIELYLLGSTNRK